LILSDGEIWEALETGQIVIDPYPSDTTLVQPSSIDLRLGPALLIQQEKRVAGVIIDLSEKDLDVMGHLRRYCEPVDISRNPYLMKPGTFVIGTTLEKITLPLDIAARVDGRSSLARFGLAVHITAPKIDPGYSNTITLEMVNLGRFDLALRQGMKVCSVIFERLGRAARQGYAGKYQSPSP